MIDETLLIDALRPLGVGKAFEALFLVPRDWIDLRPERLLAGIDAHLGEGKERAALALRVLESPRWQNDERPPRGVLRCKDALGREIRLTIFGTSWRWRHLDLSPGTSFLAEGRISQWQGYYGMTLDEAFPLEEARGILPVYPAVEGFSATSIATFLRASIDSLLPQAERAFEERLPEHYREMLTQGRSIGELLRSMHFPPRIEAGIEAREALMRCNAATLIEAARQKARDLPRREPIVPAREPLEAALERLPFSLTKDQRGAIGAILDDLQKDRPMRHLLTGDVGSGKTICYLAAVAALAHAGRRSVVILPNTVLAQQVFREFKTFFPDLSGRAHLCLGGKKAAPQGEPRVLIGTSALLHRKDLVRDVDLAVIDEQQRFSTAQRAGMRDDFDPKAIFDVHTHRLEVSATPIPRTFALAMLGATRTSRLHTGHADKRIVTRIWVGEHRKELFSHLMERIRAGEQIAIIYPLREEVAQETLRDAVGAAKQWEKLFPGKVRLVHGAQKNEEKQQAIDDMKKGEAQILISTTVIEVGVTIPSLTTMAVIDAGRFGLSQLHQLRGRLVRHGGTGYFDLFVPNPTPESLERLGILERSNDGFEIAHHDLCLRGQGSLPGTEQSGTDYGVLIPKRRSITGIDYEIIDRVLCMEQQFRERVQFDEDAPGAMAKPMFP